MLNLDFVITSYSIHYTKLYDAGALAARRRASGKDLGAAAAALLERYTPYYIQGIYNYLLTVLHTHIPIQFV